MPLELLASDATIWSIAEELSITILVTSFSLSYAVYSTGITYDDHQLKIINMFIVQTTVRARPKEM
jgi:hypothetical protein